MEFLKQLVFPIECVECGAVGTYWCAACYRSLVRVARIDGPPPLGSVRSFFPYRADGPTGELIRLFKYGFATDLVRLWREIIQAYPLSDFSGDWRRGQISKPDNVAFTPVIIPVPLHRRRERERGFNQAALIGRLLAAEYRLEIAEHVLARPRHTERQSGLAKDKRQKNLDGAFAWVGSAPAPRAVILVDDVYTTGATLRAGAEVLAGQGTEHIEAIVLARD